jgi:hypothetical protein
MTTFTNRFGEKQTNWQSHKHPERSNFMQVVKYMHIQYPDGRCNLHWALQSASANDKHIIADISLSQAQELYCDADTPKITEAEFEKWLQSK